MLGSNNNDLELPDTELNEKVNQLRSKISKTFEEVATKKEEFKRLTIELNQVNEQIRFYEKEIMSKEQVNSDQFVNNDQNEGEEVMWTPDDNDEILVYGTLKRRLEEISKRWNEVGSFAENPQVFNDEQIHFQCILVKFVEIDSTEKYQTFRITHSTKVIDVIRAALALWDQSEKINDFIFYWITSDSVKQCGHDLIINQIFKENKSQIKCAKFLLTKLRGNNLDKINFEDFDHEKDEKGSAQNNKNVFSNTNGKLQSFVENFVGVSKYLKQKYYKLHQKDVLKSKKSVRGKRWYNYCWIALQYIIFFLFFIFSIIILSDAINPFRNNNVVELLWNRISPKEEFYIKENAIIDDIINNWDLFLKEGDGTNLAPFQQIAMARFIFYSSFPKECTKEYIQEYTDKTCSEMFYKDKADNSRYDNDYFNDTLFDNINKSDEGCVYGLNNSVPFNVYNSDYIKFYWKSVFRGFYRTYAPQFEYENHKLVGDYGTYTGENGVELSISWNYINKFVWQRIWNFMEGDKKNSRNYFDYKTQKAITISFPIYNYISKSYYYIYYIYEFTPSLGTARAKVKVIPFFPNLKEMLNSSKTLILDLFRLFISIIQILILLKILYDKIMNAKSRISLFVSFLRLDLIWELIIFIVFIISFAIKNRNLYSRMDELYVSETWFPDENDEKIFFNNLPSVEYWSKANAYELMIMLESVLILIWIIRTICYISNMPRINILFKYIKISFLKAIPYFVVFIITLLIFAVLANVLWGIRFETYVNYQLSFLTTLEFTISHYKDIYSSNTNSENYEVAFVFLIFVCVIFFEMSSFIGVFIESYRINSLKFGNVYDNRLINRLIYGKDIIQQKKKRKNQKNKVISKEDSTNVI